MAKTVTLTDPETIARIRAGAAERGMAAEDFAQRVLSAYLEYLIALKHADEEGNA